MYLLELTVRAYKESVNTKKRIIKRNESFYDTWFISDSKELKDIDTSSASWSMLCRRIGVDADKWDVEPIKINDHKQLKERVMYVGNKLINV